MTEKIKLTKVQFKRWMQSQDGPGALPIFRWYGYYNQFLGAKVFFKEGVWQYNIWEKLNDEQKANDQVQKRWQNKSKGWKVFKTAIKKAEEAIGHVTEELQNENKSN